MRSIIHLTIVVDRIHRGIVYRENEVIKVKPDNLKVFTEKTELMRKAKKQIEQGLLTLKLLN